MISRTTVYFVYRKGWRVVIFSLMLIVFTAQDLQKLSETRERFQKLLLNGLVPLSRNARCSEARLRQLHLAVPAPVRFAVQISVVLKKSGKEGFLYDSL